MKYFVIAFFFSINTAYSNTRLNESVIEEYLKLQKEFSTHVCKVTTEETYNKLEKNYRGDGNYIPTFFNDKIDDKVIGKFLPLLKEKMAWIQTQIEFVKTKADFEVLIKILHEVNDELNLYLETRNKTHVERIKILIENFKDGANFLLSFKFPLDHLALRTEYDQYKSDPVLESRKRANSIYFYRKIVQDGAFDEDLSKNDSTIRAAFDTLYFSLKSKRDALSENDRVDLLFFIQNMEHLLEEGKEKQVGRLQEWQGRTNRALVFYQELLNNKKVTIDTERTRALYVLKDFVLTNEARTYEFWSRQSDLMQALFVIETILYSEIGRRDAPDALERKDVAQIIINRFDNTKYNLLTNSDSILKYLSSKITMKENKWLNILFKEGEFSFTYFYFPGNFHIYCPDMSRVGRFLRKENVRIAFEHLNYPRKKFKALRYFSRVSMYGRISMDSVWKDFVPLSESPGNLVKNPIKIFQHIKSKKYRFLYDFQNETLNKSFKVLEIKGKNYVVDSKNTKNIYYYRSPHLFKYFASLK